MTTHQPPLFGAPSTQWQEIIPPDEAQRFAAYAAEFAELQNRISARQGSGRALHRKQLWAAPATFTVLPNLPAFARYGVFAKPASYPARLRFSNGGAEKAPDARPDIRGLAFAIDGLEGLGARSALGGLAQSQCFVLALLHKSINH